jgi:gas vesicle protein
MATSSDKDVDRNEEPGVTGRSALLSTVLGFMAGALSGAMIALLVAPASGRDTRAQLGDAYRTSNLKLSRLPAALESAGKAARAAFAEARALEREAAATEAAAPADVDARRPQSETEAMDAIREEKRGNDLAAE